jgi:hypothetical protein
VSPSTAQRTFDQTYAEVQQFYARHIQLMDEGPAEEAALTFTEDASILSPPKIAEPVAGRANLVAGLRRALDTWAEAGEVFRRCYSMISVVPKPDGTLHVRSYVQVVATPRGGEPRLHAMCVCEDVLVWDGGELKVRRRVVTRDDVR